jgi:AraC-like DNA-binding protein
LAFCTGSLIFAFSNDTFSLPNCEGAEFLYVDFSGSRAEDLLHRFGVNSSNRFFDGFGGMIPFWKESLLCASPETIDLAAESVLLHTLSRMRKEKNAHNDIITSVLQIIDNEFNDHSLSITSIGEELSYHPKYLSQLFKKEVGAGFSEYLRNKRINYARALFDHGIDSIKNVALLSGFNDPLYFSSVFKKATGMSPKQYIQKQD